MKENNAILPKVEGTLYFLTAIHSTGFPLKITGFERDFVAYCYFGLCRHSIKGNTPTNTLQHLYKIPFRRCVFENSN